MRKGRVKTKPIIKKADQDKKQTYYMKQIVDFLSLYNDELNLYKGGINFFEDKRRYIASANQYYCGMNIPHDIDKRNMVEGVKNRLLINVDLLNLNNQKLIIGLYIILHELGHIIHFKQLMNRHKLDIFSLTCKIKKIDDRYDKISNGDKEKRYQLYLNSFYEKFADKYANQEIKRLIDKGIISI